MTPITDREIGAIEQKIAHLEHRLRNDKTIINGLLDEIDSVRLDLNRFKSRVYGVSSAAVLFIGLLAWIIDLVRSF